MADRNQLKIADQVDLADEDPFAELTRIMGFDPRQPAKPAAPQDLGPMSQPAPRQVAAGDDDFSIDLEKELMGEFGADDDAEESVQPARQADEVAASPEISVDAIKVDESNIDFDLADGFDDAMAASVANETEGDDIWVTDKADSGGDDRLDAPADAPPVTVELADDDVDSILEEDLVADFDAAPAEVAMDFESNPDAAEPAVAADEGEEEPIAAADETEEEPIAAADETGEDLVVVAGEDENEPIAAADEVEEELVAVADEYEDEPIAAADEVEEERVAVADEYQDEQIAAADEDEEERVAAADDNEQEDFVATDVDALEVAEEAEVRLVDEGELRPGEDDSGGAIELEGDAASATDEVDEPEARWTDAPRGESDAQQANDTAATMERSLEEELNALLGNAVPAKAGAVEASGDPMEIENLAEDLNWDFEGEEILAATDADPVEDEEPVLYVEEGAADEDSDTQPLAAADDDYDSSAGAGPEDETAEFSEDDLPDFDNDAFDAAIAKGFDGENDEEMVNAEEPADVDEPEADDVYVHAGEPSVRRDDPLDEIAALTAKYATPMPSGSYSRANNTAQAPAPAPGARRQDDEDADGDYIDFSAAFDEAPDIETVDVADRAVALADDLDIPELDYDEELPPVSAYDDLDAEFASLLSDMNAGESAQPRPTAQAAGTHDDDVVRGGRGPAHGYPAETGAASASTAAQHASTALDDDEPDKGRYDFDADNLPGSRPLEAARYEATGYEYDPELNETISDPGTVAERRPQRRGMLVAAIVGGVAIIGGLGAFALSFGDGGSGDVPVIVKADDSPVKIKPKNPGGTTVPNQESKVYDTVAGAGTPTEPQQEKLVTTAEEPVDVTPPVPEPRATDLAPAEGEIAAVASPKGEDRIEQILQDAEGDPDTEVAAVAPRKVRTMVVKPDGTLVPREDLAPIEAPVTATPEAVAPVTATPEAVAPVIATPEAVAPVIATPEAVAPAIATPEAVAPAGEAVEATAAPVAAPESTASVAPSTDDAAPTFTPPTGEAPVAVEAPVAETPPATAAEAPVQPASEAQSSMPDIAPIAPQRPAEQPIDVVGEVKADQVAAVAPAATKAAGTWSMQIASQPSEASAQSSYQDLARRFGGVLNGREVNIVKAEIAGKGTFWRVRVPAQSRNDAISLCESYKAAGGNCFVSR